MSSIDSLIAKLLYADMTPQPPLDWKSLSTGPNYRGLLSDNTRYWLLRGIQIADNKTLTLWRMAADYAHCLYGQNEAYEGISTACAGLYNDVELKELIDTAYATVNEQSCRRA